MKIAQKERDFAAKQNAGAETFIAAEISGAETAAVSKAAAVQGIEELSARFKAEGGKIIFPPQNRN